MYNFEFARPSTLKEALSCLAEEEAQPLSGGQTLIPSMKQRLNAPGTLVSLLGIDALKGVRITAGAVTIGAATNHATVARETASTFPALSGLAGGIGDPAVRNRGTIGGSLANNDPAACYPAAALACGATITTSQREIPAADYFEGMFATALEEGELITSVTFPIPEAAAYIKFEQPASRFALAGVFVAKFADGVRVAVTGVSEEGVFLWDAAGEALSTEFSADAIASLALDPDGVLSDLHAGAEYRAHLVGVLTRRAVTAARG